MAALPVGAQITIFLPIFLKLSTSPTINVLFPEPGPPVIIEKDCFKDLFIERICSFDNFIFDGVFFFAFGDSHSWRSVEKAIG